MPDFAQLAPPAFAAIAAVAVALAAECCVGVAWLAARLPWGRKAERPLLREPGNRFVRARRRALAEALACAAAIVAGLTAAIVAALVTGQAIWQPATAAVIGVTLLLGLSLRMLLLLRRARKLSRYRDTRRRVAQALGAIGGEHDRVYHDVNDGKGNAIDHVLVGNQGAFAIIIAAVSRARGDGLLRRNGRQLRLGDELRYIDEAAVQRHISTLQHELSKPFGRVLAVRGVLCVPGWRIDDNRGDELLVVGVSDVMMLQGWRTARDDFMHDDVQALHGMLSERETGLPVPTRRAAPIGKIDREAPPSADAVGAGRTA